MESRKYPLPIALALFLSVSSPLKAAEPMPLNAVSLAHIKQTFELQLPGQDKPLHPAQDSLHFVSQSRDFNHISHVRMQQYYAGFLVFGGFAIIHGSSKAQTLSNPQAKAAITGTLYPHLEDDLPPIDPQFEHNAQLALETLKANYSSKYLKGAQVRPIVYLDWQQKAHWAYKVSIQIQKPNTRPERPVRILEAHSLKPLAQWDAINTYEHTTWARGFGGNEKTGKYQYGKTKSYLPISRRKTKNICLMQNPEVTVVNMDHRISAPKKAMQFNCLESDIYTTGANGDGYDEINGAYSPSNDALDAGYVFSHLFSDWYDIPVLTKADGSPMPLIMRVHYGKEYNNAFWDGKQMTFGDGSEKYFYPLVSLSIVAHEISHGFTHQHADLEYSGESGGLNESFSDMAASAAEYYSTGKNSWKIAPEIIKPSMAREALRYMDKPSKDGKSVDDLNQYHQALKHNPMGLDVHYSSGVFNHLFYILANQPGWNAKTAFDLMVYANMHYWGPYESFQSAGCGALKAAKALSLSVEDVKRSLLEVAIKPESCMA